MKYDNLIKNAIKRAEKILSDKFSNYELLSEISKIKPCAIIGGAIRDVLVSMLSQSEIAEIPWRDIDIAIIESEYINIYERIKLFGINIKQNTFGGMKINIGKTDALDMWTIKNDPRELYDSFFWKQYLKNVDFGINAIAFILPEKRIILREEWINDYYKGIVEDHFIKAEKPELQSIRAIAIASRLSVLANKEFKLGQKCLERLNWLACAAKQEEIISVFDYIQIKMNKKKWDSSFVYLFEKMISNSEQSRYFENMLSNFIDSQRNNNEYYQINNY